MTIESELLAVLRDVAWLIVVCYAGYKIARMWGRFRARARVVEAAIAGAGGAMIWWSRVLYGLDFSDGVTLSFLVIGLALIAFPKLLGIATNDLGHD